MDEFSNINFLLLFRRSMKVNEMKMKNGMATVKQRYPTATHTRDSMSMVSGTAMEHIASKTAPNTSVSTLKARNTAKGRSGTQTARATRVAGLRIAEMAMEFTTT